MLNHLKDHTTALDASHRGLTSYLIPQWLAQNTQDLSARIDSSAYGETPQKLLTIIFKRLNLGPEHLFVDLGCGAGSVCQEALKRGCRVLGIDHNPALIDLAKKRLGNHPRLTLACTSLIDADWSEAHFAYATTARFHGDLIQHLTLQAMRAPHLQAIACLGRPLLLCSSTDKRWRIESWPPFAVCWNPCEIALPTPLTIYWNGDPPP